MNLDLKLQEHAEERPENRAIGWGSDFYTYRELNKKVQSLTNEFFRNKIQPGDRVGIILENCPEFVVSYYACMRVGAISVPINPALTARELQVIINDSKPVIIITNDTISTKLSNANITEEPKYLITQTEVFDEILASDNVKEITSSSYHDECTILYTSGTTGLPKGAILTNYSLYHNAKVFSEAFNLNEKDRTLIVPPLSHIAALSNCLNTTMCSGGYSYMLPRWESSFKTLTTMEEQEITFFFGPPTMYTYLLNDPKVKEFKLKLKNAYTGAAPLPEETFNKWVEIFGFEIVEGYGLTECSPVVSINPPDGRKKIGSIGLPIKDVRVKVVDEEFKEVPLSKSGELIVQGPNVMKEYYNKPADNKEALVNGWFKTGDIAMQDEDGYLYIVDRKKDVIIRSGFNVYPREVEEVLYQFPGVLEAAVVGFPDKDRGELVKAFITLKSGISEDDITGLREYCKERLATYKIPSTFEVIKELPKSNTGKILKVELRKMCS